MTASTSNPYILLRASLALFKKTPSELEPVQTQQLQAHAAKEINLENRVLNSSEATGVIIPSNIVDAAYAEIEQRYSNELSFLSELQKNKLTVQSLRLALQRQCKVNAVLEMIAARSPSISEVEIGLYYHLHSEKFHRPEQREACHILISINDEYAENTHDTALQRIKSVHQQLQKKPYKFADLALKHSECPTALQGGFLGRLPRGKLYPQLDEALFKLDTGAISEVLESELGFHIVLCKAIHKAQTLSLKKATPQIRLLLQERSQRTCQRAWLASLSD